MLNLVPPQYTQRAQSRGSLPWYLPIQATFAVPLWRRYIKDSTGTLYGTRLSS